MNKSVEITSISNLYEKKKAIIKNMHLIAQDLGDMVSESSWLDSLRNLKFCKTSFDPLFRQPLNFIETLNQTFTYLVCLSAAARLLNDYPNIAFILNFGTQNGFDVTSTDGTVICECFAVTTVKSNQKLIKDVQKVKGKSERSYVIFYANEIDQKYLNSVRENNQSVVIERIEFDELVYIKEF